MTSDISMAQALNTALRDCLREDETVLVCGEDVGTLGGVFRVTEGLRDEFGTDRVFDTPLAEAGIVGTSLGLCLAGFRPVCEMQFDAFSYPALDQILTHVSRYRFRTRGLAPLPMVVRIPVAGGIGAAELHSESPETYYVHTPGLKVVVPSTPLDAYSLLVSSIRDPDPVIFLEPKARYWTKEAGTLPAEGPPIGRARVLLEGTHATLVTWGTMVQRCLEAAAEAEQDGASLEVLDLRSLVPLDLDALASSVRKTGRAVVVHEAPLTAGFGAEVVARIVEDCWRDLEAAPARVTGWDIPYPPATLEHHHVPSVDRILAAVQKTFDG